MAKLFVICGHGAGDVGACGNGYQEYERVRVLGKKIKELGGANVMLGDVNRDYYQDNGISSLNISKDYQILELHMDSGVSSARGGHVIINGNYPADSYDTALANMISTMFPGRSNKIVGRNDLANVGRAAAKGYSYRLMECGFISNATDVKIFNSNIDNLAKKILQCFGIATASAPAAKPAANNPVNNAGFKYTAHCQTIGWQSQMRDGQVAGTTGSAKRLEALKFDVSAIKGLGITVKVHIQNDGWKTFKNVTKDTIVGTVGKGLRLEAIEIDATGIPSGKTLMYDAYIQDYGWTGWVKSGYTAGTVGIGKRIEAFKCKLV